MNPPPVRRWLAAILGIGLSLGDHAPPAVAAEPVQEPAQTAAAEPLAGHLQRGLELFDRGDYEGAVLEFEQVLSYDNLPPDPREQAEVYARAARGYAAGNRLSGFGYLETGGGYYHENPTNSTRAAGHAPARDWFWAARAGGGLAYLIGDDLSIEGNLDYRFRYYDDPQRRDDSDLRWRAVLTQSLARGSQGIGVRGRTSYRGVPGYRQDYGLFAFRHFDLNATNRLSLEGELRTRQYPAALRERTYHAGEFWLKWTRSLWDGRGALTLGLNAGQEWSTHQRPDGNNTFYGMAFDWSLDLNPRLGVFLSGFWERNAFAEDHDLMDDDDQPIGVDSRCDDQYELGGGLIYTFAPGWSLRPEVLWKRDVSNRVSVNYSATELWLMIRKAF
jgi:hypothetical protein